MKDLIENNLFELKLKINNAEHLWKEISAFSNSKLISVQQLKFTILIGNFENQDSIDILDDETISIVNRVLKDCKSQYNIDSELLKELDNNEKIKTLKIVFRCASNNIVRTPKNKIYIRDGEESRLINSDEYNELCKYKSEEYLYSKTDYKISGFSFSSCEELLDIIIDTEFQNSNQFCIGKYLTRLGYLFSDQIKYKFNHNGEVKSGNLNEIFSEFQRIWKNWLNKKTLISNTIRKTNNEIINSRNKNYNDAISRELFFNTLAHGLNYNYESLFFIDEDEEHFSIKNYCNHNNQIKEWLDKNKNGVIPNIPKNPYMLIFLLKYNVVESRNIGMKLLKENSIETNSMISIKVESDSFEVDIITSKNRKEKVRNEWLKHKNHILWERN